MPASSTVYLNTAKMIIFAKPKYCLNCKKNNEPVFFRKYQKYNEFSVNKCMCEKLLLKAIVLYIWPSLTLKLRGTQTTTKTEITDIQSIIEACALYSLTGNKFHKGKRKNASAMSYWFNRIISCCRISGISERHEGLHSHLFFTKSA